LPISPARVAANWLQLPGSGTSLVTASSLLLFAFYFFFTTGGIGSTIARQFAFRSFPAPTY
jgi:hypothetical protein